MEKTSLSAVGGIVASIIASLCCIGPAIVVLIGIGSVGAFAIFETYRPYLIGVTVALLGVAFWLVYRKREVHCEDGTCRIQNAAKWNKVGIWSATFVAVLAIGFPYLGLVPSSSVNTGVRASAIVTLKIEGMDCNACAKGIGGSLTNVKGVRKALVKYEDGKAVIEYNPVMIKPEQLVKRVSENGFTATIIEQRKEK